MNVASPADQTPTSASGEPNKVDAYRVQSTYIALTRYAGEMDLRHPFDVVAHPAQGAALSVLAGADAAFTPPQVQRIAGQFSVDGIRRALERLTEQGIVDSQRTGNAISYRLNRAHLAAPAVLSLASLWDEFLRRMTDSIAAWERAPVFACVFGSSARGEMRATSDIDVFLVRRDAIQLDDDDWLSQCEALTAAGRSWTGNVVNILEFSETETLEGLAMQDSVLDDIERDGISVSGPPRYIQNLRRRLANG